MALSDDQRALLRLLAQREEGYEDIAALKGIGVDRIRAEVREALAALDAPPPEPPAPTPPAPPAAPEPEPVPPPTPQEQKPAPGTPAPAVRPKGTTPSAARRPGVSVPAERRRLLLLSGGALGIVAMVLGAIALIGGSSDSSSESGSSVAGTELAAGEEGKVTQAVLTPPDGGDANGQAVFGRVGKDEIVLQVTAEGLEPTAKGESYIVWLYRNPKLALRVGSVGVGEEGRLGARFAIPSELLAYVASGAFNQIYVSRTENAAYQREVARAKRNNQIPRYTGETALTGRITGPIAKESASR